MSNSLSLHSIYVDQMYYGGENSIYSFEQLVEAAHQYHRTAGRSYTGLKPRLRLNIWDSLIYKVASGSVHIDEYIKYLEVNPQAEHSAYIFNKLISEFSLEKLVDQKIKLVRIRNGYQVIDGVHRLALYFAKTQKFTIPQNYVDILGQTNSNRVDINLKKFEKVIRRWLGKTKGGRFSNGWSVSKNTNSGYHGYSIFGLTLIGQRNPATRLEIIEKEYPLGGSNILDLGCNTGGMLFHINNPGKCVGVDFDQRCIKAANKLKGLIGKFDPEFSSRFHFQVADLNSEFGEIVQLISKYKIKVCFLLSIGSWVANWRQLYTIIINANIVIFLETNNDGEGAPQLELIRNHGYEVIQISSQSTDDSTGNFTRRTFICRPGRSYS